MFDDGGSAAGVKYLGLVVGRSLAPSGLLGSDWVWVRWIGVSLGGIGGDARCFAVPGEQSKLYTMPSITETLDLARYRDENGRPLLDVSLLGNRDAQMNYMTNPLPMVSQAGEPTFSSIHQ